MGIGTIGTSSGLQPAMPIGATSLLASGSTSNLWETITVSLSPGNYVVSGTAASETVGVKFFAPNSKTSAIAYAGKPANLKITKAETSIQVATRWTVPKSLSSSNVRNQYSSNIPADTNYSRYAGYVTPDMNMSSVRNTPNNNGYMKLVKTGFDDISTPNGEWGSSTTQFSSSYIPQSLAISPVTGSFLAGSYNGIAFTGMAFRGYSTINLYSSDEWWPYSSWCQDAYDAGYPPFVALGTNSNGYASYAILNDPTNSNPALVAATRNTSTTWTSGKAYMFDAATTSYYFVGGYMSTARYNISNNQWSNLSYVDNSIAATGIVKSGPTFVVTATANRIYTSDNFSGWTYHTPTVRFSNGTTGALNNASWAAIRKEGSRITIWTGEGDAYYQNSFSTTGIWERAEVADIPIRNGWVADTGAMTTEYNLIRSLYSNINEPVPTIHANSSTNLSQESYYSGSLIAAPTGIRYSVYSGA